MDEKFTINDCSWKKMVIAKANNAWTSTIQSEQIYDKFVCNIKVENMEEDFHEKSSSEKEDYEKTSGQEANERTTPEEANGRTSLVVTDTPIQIIQNLHPLLIESSLVRKTKRRRRKKIMRKSETPEKRMTRLAKMSAYASQRLANETPEQRDVRLKRMSQYAAKRLSQETIEQRAKRLAKMSAYAAKRLAEETPEQRKARLTRMSAYANRKSKRNKLSSYSEEHSI